MITIKKVKGIIAAFLVIFCILAENGAINAAQNPEELTLKGAIKLSYKQALKWSKRAKLIRAISVDTTLKAPKTKEIPGFGGKRENWDVYFTDKQTTHEYIVAIRQGSIAKYQQTEYGDKEIIKNSDIKIDSDKALAKVIKAKKIKPGKDWAFGYHYILNYSNNKLLLQIVALSPRNNYSMVFMNAKTGKIIEADEKTYDKKGKALWKKF